MTVLGNTDLERLVNRSRLGGRQTAAVGLSLLFAVFLFASGLHSVHHLTEPDEASTCELANASGHLNVISPESVAHDLVLAVVVRAAARPASLAPAARPLSPSLGRAPPPSTA